MCSAGGLMLKFSGLLCFLLLAVVSAAGEESFPARERGTEPFPFQERFQKEFRELFEMLAKEYPQFRNRLEEPDVDRALVAVMDSLGAGVSVERNASRFGEENKEDAPGSPTVEWNHVFPAGFDRGTGDRGTAQAVEGGGEGTDS